MHKPEAARKLVPETFTGLERGDPRDPWVKRSVLWRLLRGLKNTLTNLPPTVLANRIGPEAFIRRGANTDRKRQNLIRTLADVTASLDEHARNVKEMAALARAKSVLLIVVSQPTMWRPGLRTLRNTLSALTSRHSIRTCPCCTTTCTSTKPALARWRRSSLTI